ncbi:MAG: Gfo/Idh/MocA family oxidoreductase [Lentisphaeria bacterium]|nr:Gfo/Idh/MocA family oxidoreductase [Lentisphaeria bacterium]
MPQDKNLKVAIIGLDTSHAVEFPKRMQDLSIPPERHVDGLTATRCLSFPTAFTNAEELAQQKAYLEKIGVEVTDDLEYAVGDCDGIMIEINDPALHLEYFTKCAEFGKPIFLDKPFADTDENARKILTLAREKNIRLFSSSALRYDSAFVTGLETCPFTPTSAIVWGPLGRAAAGSSLVWYGCHSFEMFEAVMGRGAAAVYTYRDRNSCVCSITYRDGRHGVVELNGNAFRYGLLLRDNVHGASVIQPGKTTMFYTELLKRITSFMQGEDILPLEDSLEVISILSAADRSLASGKNEIVYSL